MTKLAAGAGIIAYIGVGLLVMWLV